MRFSPTLVSLSFRTLNLGDAVLQVARRRSGLMARCLAESDSAVCCARSFSRSIAWLNMLRAPAPASACSTARSYPVLNARLRIAQTPIPRITGRDLRVPGLRVMERVRVSLQNALHVRVSLPAAASTATATPRAPRPSSAMRVAPLPVASATADSADQRPSVSPGQGGVWSRRSSTEAAT